MKITAGPSTYFDPTRIDTLDTASADLVRRRLRVLGPAYRLFYEKPLQFVRGSGCTLTDVNGIDYLDAYNNVPSVGHAHPRVVAAIAEQAALLNTHTRYLHEGIVRYSEELLATMPAALGHIMYSCTGSEAGDLALRIAKHATGGTGVIVTRNAYHGVTTEVAAISPSLGGVASIAPWVRVVPAPDPARVPEGSDVGTWFAQQVSAAIDDLNANGIQFAAFIADSVFASDGVLTDPAGFLRPVLDVVHARGGLYIADEVQPGFGRTGDALWGFARHGTPDAPFVPDIVTLGKPMGNGMPVAATIMRPEVVERFGREARYFSTFGGNPVSMAAAQAVLDILRDEDLQGNALRVGSAMRAQLRELAKRHDAIGEIRGAGLFIGVTLVDAQQPKQPATDFTLRVVNALQRRRILVATGGLHNDSLKIRPPLCFTAQEAARFVGELDAVLSELAGL